MGNNLGRGGGHGLVLLMGEASFVDRCESKGAGTTRRAFIFCLFLFKNGVSSFMSDSRAFRCNLRLQFLDALIILLVLASQVIK